MPRIEHNIYEFFFGSKINDTGNEIVLHWSNGKEHRIPKGERIYLPKQLEALNATRDPTTEILFMGGALGGSKSHGGRGIVATRIIEWSRMRGKGMVEDKPIKGAIFSENYPVLKGRHIDPISAWPRWLGKYYKADKEFRIHDDFGGGIIRLLNLDAPEKYASDEYAIAFIDESTFNDEKTINDINARVRWPGLMDTVLVLASNPGRIGHCVREGEVLTPNGWVDIRDMKVGDSVYTVLSDRTLQETVVDQVHSSYYDGVLMQVNARGLFMECTPEHKVAVLSDTKQHRNTGKFSLKPFNKMPGSAAILRTISWEGAYVDKFVLPHYPAKRLKLKQPAELPIDLFVEFLGWFLSEGHALMQNTSPKHKVVGISQMKKEGKTRIRNLLKECGFSFRENKGGFNIFSPAWWNYLRQFGKSRQKFIPAWIKNLPPAQLQILFDALMAGDGHRVSATSGQYYTISKRLADDVAEIAVKLGYIIYTSSRTRPNRIGESYCINFCKNRKGGTEILTGQHLYDVDTRTKRKSDIREIPYAGKVYCIGIKDTHSFVIRQRGSVWVSGNSFHKKRFVDPKTRDEGVVFIPSLLRDNPFLSLDPKYLKKLQRYPKKLVKAWVEGSWDQFEGQYFPDLNDEIHLVQPFRIPQEWLRFRVLDHGFKHPTACLWGAVDPEGCLYIYMSYEALETTADVNKKHIQDLSADPVANYGLPSSWRPSDKQKAERYVCTYGDPALKRIDGSAIGNKTPWDVYNAQDDGIGSFYVVEAARERVEGWQALQQAFHYEVDSEASERDQTIVYSKAPQIKIFDLPTHTAHYGVRGMHSGNALWEELSGLVYDNKNTEDAAKSKGYYDVGEGDDSAECLRYFWTAVGKTDLSAITTIPALAGSLIQSELINISENDIRQRIADKTWF